MQKNLYFKGNEQLDIQIETNPKCSQTQKAHFRRYATKHPRPEEQKKVLAWVKQGTLVKRYK